MKVKILNISNDLQHIDIIPPTTPFFKIEYEKKGLIACGVSEDITIKFIPTTWKYYYDCIRIHSPVENLLIPIHAYPVVNDIIFPKLIEFGECKIGKTYTKKIPIRCNVPIEFEYELKIINENEDITIYPLNGIIPANDTTEVLIQYHPSNFTTANCDISVNISQFNFEPFNCHISGFSSPNSTTSDLLYQKTNNYDQTHKEDLTLTKREDTVKTYTKTKHLKYIERMKQIEAERNAEKSNENIDIGVFLLLIYRLEIIEVLKI